MSTDPLTDCRFTYEHFRSVLKYAQSASYQFLSFPEARDPGSQRYILLRHDVDHSPEQAVVLAEVEAELHVRATYFVLPHGQYNVLGSAHSAIRGILELGHWLGIHYDPSFYFRQGLPFPDAVQQEAAMLEDRFGVPVSVAARHNPTTGGAVNADLAPLIDAYAEEFVSDIKYLSDSCQFWRDGCFCLALLGGQHDALHVLTHAEWWTVDGVSADVALNRIRDQRMAAVTDEDRKTRRLFASLEHLPHRNRFAERP